ncbi:hypothetical protein SBD_1044 [Streptomyces bottropensis ATCC 25435]|uniref:Uncharacterized protein n=1 Tax=Streptomyces bottropensis ATCC 25435 TaxID=1054862 RepID=M3EPD3_9ACTN|nr:hypothetical protein SBD_1044 [Streptomyces bottropensis ATCC 25435]
MRFPHVQPALAPSVGVPFHDRRERATGPGRSAASPTCFGRSRHAGRPTSLPHHHVPAAPGPLTSHAHPIGWEGPKE